MQAIETYYNGYKFRSRLEARWAVFFDSLKIPYLYEPEGFSIHGIRYLPDFYLLDSKQFFEVKGQMSDRDMEKIKAVINEGYSVVIGYDNGEFTACNCWGENSYTLSETGESWLCKCRKCGKYWFMGYEGAYHCECCGEYDGDKHFEVLMESSYDTELWDVARQARFEFNDTPRKKEHKDYFKIRDVKGNEITIRPWGNLKNLAFFHSELPMETITPNLATKLVYCLDAGNKKVEEFKEWIEDLKEMGW